MHILLIADGRSPTTHHWVQSLLAGGQRVSLVSTFPCAESPGIEALYVLPVAFSGLAGGQVGARAPAAGAVRPARRAVSRFRNILLALRYRLGPLTLAGQARAFQRIVAAVQPDVVHALRIPFEGMLGAYTPPDVPFVVSIWGNDLTLHAAGSASMGRHTRLTLQRADGLMADTLRDLRLAGQWGFAADRPALAVPGSGGLDLREAERVRALPAADWGDFLQPDTPLVINPRGFRPGSVRNDVFFQAVPMILERLPQTRFVCAAMQGQPEALQWVERYRLQHAVRLLPFLPQDELWQYFLRAQVTVSISVHDGTPNSLLEAMSCGCFPVAGDIESLREWITPGVNGLLVEPSSAQGLAEAVITALTNDRLRRQAAEYNRALLRERADVQIVRARVLAFYRQLAGAPEDDVAPGETPEA